MTDKDQEIKGWEQTDLPDVDEPIFTPGDPNNTYLPPLPSEGDEDAYEEQKSPFRRIWDRYSYSAVRVYLTQFAIGIFGGSLAYSLSASAGTLFWLSSAFAILFFAVLVYTVVWNVGSADRISVESGKRKRNLFVGLLLGLAAGIPNFLLATVHAIGLWLGIGNICAITYVIITFTEGMYSGLSLWIAGVRGTNELAVNQEIASSVAQCWWLYFVIAFITVLIVAFSYVMGYLNVGLPKALTNRGEEAERAEREKRRPPKQKS